MADGGNRVLRRKTQEGGADRKKRGPLGIIEKKDNGPRGEVAETTCLLAWRKKSGVSRKEDESTCYREIKKYRPLQEDET